jgi:hypothetical protein
MTFTPAPRSLDSLAWRIAEHGIDAELAAVQDFARRAVAAGVPESLVAVMLDAHQPDIARQRAFGAVAADLARRQESSAPPGFVIAA